MLKKLLVFAITSGLAAKLYKRYAEKQAGSRSQRPTSDKPVARGRATQKEA
jgi:uncharacterized membrane-anchored protein